MIQHNRQQILVPWVIWAALFGGIVAYQFALGGGVPSGQNAPTTGTSLPMALSVAQIATASVIRWFVIPRARTPGELLVRMVTGLALSEAVEFYGIFLVPSDQPGTKLTLWVLSLLSAAQFVPVYAQLEGNNRSAFRSG